LRGSDFRATGESAAAAVFEAWYIQLAQSVFADELGESLWRSYSGELHMVSMALAAAVRAQSEWCDDIRTPARETCAVTASTALGLALARMAAVQGTNDAAAWQ
jgi:penicillin amidase